jgi:multiple sugar transport system permease protein
MKIKGLHENVIIIVILMVALCITLFPVYWIVTMSFKPYEVCYSYPPKFLPYLDFIPNIDGWNELRYGYLSETFLRYTENSIIISICSALLALTLGVPAGYSLARFKFYRIKNQDIAYWILSNRMFPLAAALIPFLLMYKFTGLFDTHIGMVIAHTAMNLPFITWLVREFFMDLPIEVEEAAMVDGCSRMKAFVNIALPLTRPVIATAFILGFIFSWNELFFAVSLTLYNAPTLSVLLSATSISPVAQIWNGIGAMCTFHMLPPLILSIAAQRYIVRGLTFGAVKG